MAAFLLRKCLLCLLHLLFTLHLFLINTAECGSVVQTLPGFNGTLPFVLETGYTRVGDVEFFYYFVESESEPDSDPLFLYINGGPGCSGLNGFFYQIGPLEFDGTDYKGGLPQLLYYSKAWTQVANIIFLDAPVGTGFSYATTDAAYATSDSYNVEQVHGFMRKWLEEHPRFVWNPFYIGTDSYAGIYVPMLAQRIIDGNEAGMEPRINLKGFSAGSAHTDTDIEENTKVILAHRFGLVSDELYEAARNACHGWYVNIDSSNTKCIETVAAVEKMYADIALSNILEPYCAFISPQLENDEDTRRSLSESSTGSLRTLSNYSRNDGELQCHNYPYSFMNVWANNESVRKALHVRPVCADIGLRYLHFQAQKLCLGTVKTMQRCNISLSYTTDVTNVLPFHVNLTDSGLQALVFGGDHDLIIPHVGTEEWIKAMNLTVDADWRPWFVDGQVAGYTVKYTNDGYRLTYATVKGAGHSAQEYERRICYIMFDRWIHYYPL